MSQFDNELVMNQNEFDKLIQDIKSIKSKTDIKKQEHNTNENEFINKILSDAYKNKSSNTDIFNTDSIEILTNNLQSDLNKIQPNSNINNKKLNTTFDKIKNN